MTKQRLARLEKEVRLFGSRPCALCWGLPVVTVEVELERDPEGPGFRRTGVQTVNEWHTARITDDLRCRRCGAQAAVTLLMLIKGVHQDEQ